MFRMYIFPEWGEFSSRFFYSANIFPFQGNLGHNLHYTMVPPPAHPPLRPPSAGGVKYSSVHQPAHKVN